MGSISELISNFASVSEDIEQTNGDKGKTPCDSLVLHSCYTQDASLYNHLVIKILERKFTILSLRSISPNELSANLLGDFSLKSADRFQTKLLGQRTGAVGGITPCSLPVNCKKINFAA